MAEMKNSMDRASMLEYAREQALKEGLEKGLEQGLEQGLEKGLEESYNKKLTIAKKKYALAVIFFFISITKKRL